MTFDPARCIIRGAWQLTPDHLRWQPLEDRLAPLLDALAAGFRTFDGADIYPGVEELLGRVRAHARDQGVEVRIHTKCVPDRDQLLQIGRAEVRRSVDRSLQRLHVERLDLVQFHWWDCRVPRYLEVLGYLFELQREGKVKDIGLTNFDSGKLVEILQAGFPIASLQLQCSLVDRRAEASVLPLCRQRGIQVFAYGSLLGGFLREDWLGQPAPDAAALHNRSLVKYRLIIDEWGGWDKFQDLLADVGAIARAHGSSMARVAVAALLGSQRADAVIVGISGRNFRRQNADLVRPLDLAPGERAQLWSWESPIAGDVYELERTSPKHVGIMRYNLNQQAAVPPKEHR